MSIEQNSTITVGSGADARTFGISKSLDNYSIDELLGIGEWAYSAFNDSEMNANVYSDINTSGTMIDIAEGQYACRVVCYPDNQLMSKGYNTNSEGVFFRNVLIYYDVTETNWVSSSVNVDAGRFPHYYVVTDIDLQDLVINALSDPNAVAPSYTTMKLGVNDVTIAPFQLYLDQNGELSLNMLLPPVGGRSSTINSNSDLVCYSVSYGNWSVYTASGGGGRNIKDQMPFHFFNPNHVDYPFQNSRIPGTQVLTDADKLIQCVKTDDPNTPARFHFQYKVELMDKPYIDSARCGIRFKINDTIYKPIVENGMITGYTDDDTAQSEWDTWENIKDHVTPSERPLPPDSPLTDKEHEMPLAYISGNAGMVTFYEINKTGLASADEISDAISRFDISQIGKDVLRNFISYKAFAAINVNDTVDRQIKIAGIPLEDSVGHELTGRVIGGVKPINLFPTSGGVTIPTLYNDYRDYEPYTRIQMYVPFCGWFTLPSWCIGKKITGTMFTDLYNGTVKAVIKASDTVVAEVGGCCAYDIPFVADATGAKASAVISSALTTAAAVGATVAMPNVATGIAAVSAAANLAATLNGNDTTLKGVLGDGSNLNGLLHVYIKVSRPKSPNELKAIPDSYKHEIGIPTMKEIELSAGDGYIQVMDAKVTGTMTSREKQMIVDGFRHGLNF